VEIRISTDIQKLKYIGRIYSRFVKTFSIYRIQWCRPILSFVEGTICNFLDFVREVWRG